MDQFQPSVEMSTYLVAFVICDFANVSKSTSDGIKVSIYAPSTMISQADYALDVTIKLLDYYQEFFRVSYPLPKQGNNVEIIDLFKTFHLILLCRSHCNTKFCCWCYGKLGTYCLQRNCSYV